MKLTPMQQKLAGDNYWIASDIARRNFHTLCKSAGMSHNDKKAEASIGLVIAAARYDPAKGKFSTYAYQWAKQTLYNGALKRLKQINKLEYVDELDCIDREPNLRLTNIDVMLKEVKRLPTRLNDMVARYYGIGREEMTLEQIGKVHGISRERVRQLIVRSIEMIHDGMVGALDDLDEFNARPWPGKKAENVRSMKTIKLIEKHLVDLDGMHTVTTLVRCIAHRCQKLGLTRIYQILSACRDEYLTPGKLTMVREEWKRAYLAGIADKPKLGQ